MRSAWAGVDLLTVDSGVNPLLASYVGAPHQIRGTDPADYATTARDWWQALGGQVVGPDPAATPVQPAGLGLPGWVPGADTLNAFGLGAAGVLLALLVVAFGLFVLWRS